ncbi:hypothetical protein [Massilia sp. LjRoot122]|uniref:hypothetical protein n=1 Tax=Massilia sp. LjRoot122 TaxID=3342257 RepID=UPI003ECE494B
MTTTQPAIATAQVMKTACQRYFPIALRKFRIAAVISAMLDSRLRTCKKMQAHQSIKGILHDRLLTEQLQLRVRKISVKMKKNDDLCNTNSSK